MHSRHHGAIGGHTARNRRLFMLVSRLHRADAELREQQEAFGPGDKADEPGSPRAEFDDEEHKGQ